MEKGSRPAGEPFRLLTAVVAAAILSSCALSPAYTPYSDMAAENLSIADGYFDIGQYDKATTYYKKAQRAGKYRNAADWGLARVAARKGDWPLAVSLLERLHSMDAKNFMVTEAYAYALIASGNAERGVGLYESLAKERNDSPEAAVNYAEALVLAGKWEDALAAAAEARKAFPDGDSLSRLDAVEEKARAAHAPKEDQRGDAGTDQATVDPTVAPGQ